MLFFLSVQAQELTKEELAMEPGNGAWECSWKLELMPGIYIITWPSDG